MMVKKGEHETQEEAPGIRPPDFLHFPHGAPSHDYQEKAYYDEELEFCSDQVDWNARSHTIDWDSPTPEHREPAFGARAWHFDENIAARPPEQQVLHKASAYDTKSVSIVPVLNDDEKSGKNINVLSPKKILCLSIVSLVFIPLLIVASLGVFNKGSSTPVPPIDNTTNVVGGENGSGAADDDVAINVTKPPSAVTKPPSAAPTFAPTTRAPTETQTLSPVADPIDVSPVTYRPGLLNTQENGLILSQGLKSRMLARTGEFVKYHNDINSTIRFHIRPDGAATFEVPDDDETNPEGWVYVSNSEGKIEGTGGVFSIHFNKQGEVIGYRNLLNGTTMNCSGGKTAWHSWISCEEYAPGGQIYQVDPFGRRQAEKTTISTRQGGRYEAFAYDDRNKMEPVFFVTEDQRNGPTRRFRPDLSLVDFENDPWSMLHGDQGKVDYLVLNPNNATDKRTGTYEWIDSIHQARRNAFITYPSAEGIDVYEGKLYMTCKRENMLYIMDLDSNAYVRYSLEIALFEGEPDGITRLLNDTSETLYFQEDLGNVSGVHARNTLGQMFTILEGPGWSNEVTGLAFSPSGHHMYLCFQEDGVLFEITREDGHSFTGGTLNVRYHHNSDSLRARHRQLYY